MYLIYELEPDRNQSYLAQATFSNSLELNCWISIKKETQKVVTSEKERRHSPHDRWHSVAPHLDIPRRVHHDALARPCVTHKVAEVAHLLGGTEDLVLHEVEHAARADGEVPTRKQLQTPTGTDSEKRRGEG